MKPASARQGRSNSQTRNKAGRSPASRPYDNRLREEQAQQTKSRILDAAVELFSKAGANATISDLAAQAGVSEPTVYRHFGTREKLYEELNEHVHARLRMPPFPDRVDDLPSQAKELFAKFAEHSDLLRAAVSAGLGKEIHKRGKAQRTRRVRELLHHETSHLSEREAHAVAAIYRLLVGWETWQRLTEELGLKNHEAQGAIAWTIGALTDSLRRERAKGKRTLAIKTPETEEPS